MHSAVPNNMDERDQVAALKGSSPGDAVSAKPVSPRCDISVVIAESKSMKAGDLFVIGIEVGADLVGRDHGWNLLICRGPSIRRCRDSCALRSQVRHRSGCEDVPGDDLAPGDFD